MADTSTDAVQRLAGSLDDLGYPYTVTRPAATTLRALSAERDALTAEVKTVLNREAESIARHDAKVEELEARVRELEEGLRPFVDAAAHTRQFLVIKERVHPAGVSLFDEDVVRARSLLPEGK